MCSSNCAETELETLTEKLNEDSAIVDQHRPSMNLNVHFGKHLDSV